MDNLTGDQMSAYIITIFLVMAVLVFGVLKVFNTLDKLLGSTERLEDRERQRSLELDRMRTELNEAKRQIESLGAGFGYVWHDREPIWLHTPKQTL